MSGEQFEFARTSAEGNAALDEEIMNLGGRGPHPSAQRILVLVVAAVVAGLIAWRVEISHAGNSRAHEAAPPSRSPSQPVATTPEAPPTVAGAFSSTPIRHGNDPTACPGLTCRTTATLPPATVAAIRHAFGQVQILRPKTVELAEGAQRLWYRSVTVRAGRSTLHLTIEAPTTRQPIDPATAVLATLSPHAAAQGVSASEHRGDLFVLISVSGSSDPETIDGVDMLLDDAAIVAI